MDATNGGQPLWGYKTQRLELGTGKNGRPLIKSIWVLDDTVVAGRPVHEWTRHCLLELAAKGASLDSLRNFCNEQGLPARRNPYWSTSTWNSILQPSCLLKYCGFEVWNVHTKRGSVNPASEWTIVENAHQALITEEQAMAIVSARKDRKRTGAFDRGYGRSRKSPYLLSGGLFKCDRCGSNMTGYKASNGYTYYICGSQPYRKSMGCGQAVYVPKKRLEEVVLKGVQRMLGPCIDSQGLIRKINEKVRSLWQASHSIDPHAEAKMKSVTKKIENIRRAIEDGIHDAGWANSRLKELLEEKASLEAKTTPVTKPPKIDTGTVVKYLKDMQRVLKSGQLEELKNLVRLCVQKIRRAPEDRLVEITYRVPEPFVIDLVAGARYKTLRQLMLPVYQRKWTPPRAGRHSFQAYV
jgi:hypothetical protein